MAAQRITEQGHLPRDLYKDWKYGGVRCEDIDWKNRVFTFVCNGTTAVCDENGAENMTSTKRELIDDVVEHVKKKAVEAFVVTPSDNKEEEPAEAVKSKGILGPQEYLRVVTGKYYFLKHNQSTTSEIKMLLKTNKKNLRDYPMDRIDLVIKDKAEVVLVDVSYYKGDSFVIEYRWFEVDCDIDEGEWD